MSSQNTSNEASVHQAGNATGRSFHNPEKPARSNMQPKQIEQKAMIDARYEELWIDRSKPNPPSAQSRQVDAAQFAQLFQDQRVHSAQVAIASFDARFYRSPQ
jgi:hypothetical protein